ncbi:MAG: hypothetical protein Q7U64_12580 [Desulfocapsaceae bacterium]|nr:hypothetical protein [Desulfocapsaceae bacterium]
MELIFNNNSLDASLQNKDSAKVTMKIFADTINLASYFGSSPIVRTHEDFWGGVLAPGYSIADWGFDHTVDIELRRKIKSCTNKAPFIESIIKTFEANVNQLHEYSSGGNQTNGLGAAIITSNPAVSLCTDQWCIDPIEVLCSYLSETETVIRTESVCNLYNPQRVRCNHELIKLQLASELNSGQDILDKSDVVLSRIKFTPLSRRHLDKLTGNEKVFPFVVKHLLALNSQCCNWTNGVYTTGYPYPCSEESGPTMNKYGEDRLFTLDDGSNVTFTWHSKISVDSWRIYFLHYASSNIVVVPYIGPHLPTVGDPT